MCWHVRCRGCGATSPHTPFCQAGCWVLGDTRPTKYSTSFSKCTPCRRLSLHTPQTWLDSLCGIAGAETLSLCTLSSSPYLFCNFRFRPGPAGCAPPGYSAGSPQADAGPRRSARPRALLSPPRACSFDAKEQKPRLPALAPPPPVTDKDTPLPTRSAPPSLAPPPAA